MNKMPIEEVNAYIRGVVAGVNGGPPVGDVQMLIRSLTEEPQADTTWSGTLTSPDRSPMYNSGLEVMSAQEILGVMSVQNERIAELEACLKIAMDQWAGWLDDGHGVPPEKSCEKEEWARCKAALYKS